MSKQSQNEFHPDWDAVGALVAEHQRMATDIETLKRCLFQAQEASKQLAQELELAEKRLHEVAKHCADVEQERSQLSALVTSQGIRLMEYESEPEMAESLFSAIKRLEMCRPARFEESWQKNWKDDK